MKKKILITGGAGFIGSHVVKLFVKKYKDYSIFNLDKLTYAGNLENLKEIESHKNYTFVKGDVENFKFILELFQREKFDGIIHLAAETHVDRSLDSPSNFAITNVVGTTNLLTASRLVWDDDFKNKIFLHISTDEVYGSAEKGTFFTENTVIEPHSPYSASKAASDYFVSAFYYSYGMPVIITRCSNNYGPNQFPEKLIPLMINNIIKNQPLPVYGKGNNVRDWLYVVDHARAIEAIFHSDKYGEIYNIGGNNEWKNIDLINLLCEIMDRKLNRPNGQSKKLITFVKDRLGHDLRYAIDSSKLQQQLRWSPSVDFITGLESTVDWYLENSQWLNSITSGEYKLYYSKMYQNR